MLRFCIVNPRTTVDDLAEILDTLRLSPPPVPAMDLRPPRGRIIAGTGRVGVRGSSR